MSRQKVYDDNAANNNAQAAVDDISHMHKENKQAMDSKLQAIAELDAVLDEIVEYNDTLKKLTIQNEREHALQHSNQALDDKPLSAVDLPAVEHRNSSISAELIDEMT
eukprot:2361925-Rhodomonas_salina.1